RHCASPSPTIYAGSTSSSACRFSDDVRAEFTEEDMQSRMPIVVALVVGLVAAVLTKLYVDQIRQAAQPETSRVMLAVRDLPPGTSLEARDVTPGDRDTRSLPKLAIRWDERNLYFGQQLAM